ncbi:MAG: hypothetical protein PHV79_01120 [Clostridia bacterium]|nr:hypothetical protein [Clostridia bacterium]
MQIKKLPLIKNEDENKLLNHLNEAAFDIVLRAGSADKIEDFSISNEEFDFEQWLMLNPDDKSMEQMSALIELYVAYRAKKLRIKNLSYTQDEEYSGLDPLQKSRVIFLPNFLFYPQSMKDFLLNAGTIEQLLIYKKYERKKLRKSREKGIIYNQNFDYLSKYLTYKYKMLPTDSPYMKVDQHESIISEFNSELRVKANYAIEDIVLNLHRTFQNALLNNRNQYSKNEIKILKDELEYAELISKGFNLCEERLRKDYYSDEAIEKLTDLQLQTKNDYYNLCTKCLNGKPRFHDVEWIILTTGLAHPMLYDDELADAFYEACFERRLVQGCFNILNSPEHILDADELAGNLEELILIGKDDPYFEQVYYNMLDNFDFEFLKSFYNIILKENKRNVTFMNKAGQTVYADKLIGNKEKQLKYYFLEDISLEKLLGVKSSSELER